MTTKVQLAHPRRSVHLSYTCQLPSFFFKKYFRSFIPTTLGIIWAQETFRKSLKYKIFLLKNFCLNSNHFFVWNVDIDFSVTILAMKNHVCKLWPCDYLVYLIYKLCRYLQSYVTFLNIDILGSTYIIGSIMKVRINKPYDICVQFFNTSSSVFLYNIFLEDVFSYACYKCCKTMIL